VEFTMSLRVFLLLAVLVAAVVAQGGPNVKGKVDDHGLNLSPEVERISNYFAKRSSKLQETYCTKRDADKSEAEIFGNAMRTCAKLCDPTNPKARKCVAGCMSKEAKMTTSTRF